MATPTPIKASAGRHRIERGGWPAAQLCPITVNTSYARYIGRVGALAVAIGVGAAVATTPGVAWADTGEGPAQVDSPPSQETETKPPANDNPKTGETGSGVSGKTPTTTTTAGGQTSTTVGGNDSPKVTISASTVDRSDDDAKVEGETLTQARKPTQAPTPVDLLRASVDRVLGALHLPAAQMSIGTQTPAAQSNATTAEPTGTPHASPKIAPLEENSTTVAQAITTGVTTAVIPMQAGVSFTPPNRSAALRTAQFSSAAITFDEPAPANPVESPLGIPATFISAALNLFSTAMSGGPAGTPDNPLLLALMAWGRKPATEEQDVATLARTGEPTAALAIEPTAEEQEFPEVTRTVEPAAALALAPAGGPTTLDDIGQLPDFALLTPGDNYLPFPVSITPATPQPDQPYDAVIGFRLNDDYQGPPAYIATINPATQQIYAIKPLPKNENVLVDARFIAVDPGDPPPIDPNTVNPVVRAPVVVGFTGPVPTIGKPQMQLQELTYLPGYVPFNTADPKVILTGEGEAAGRPDAFHKYRTDSRGIGSRISVQQTSKWIDTWLPQLKPM